MTTLYRAILVAGFMATASLADMDSQRMQRDIRIMEGVLGNLYHDAPDPIHFSSRGLYLDGYGVLFFIQGSWPGKEHPSIAVAWDEKGVEFVELKSGDSSSYEKSLAESHDLLAEFLGNYAGIIGQLDPDDRITVCYQHPRSGGLASGLKNITDGFTFGVKTETDSVYFDLTTQIEAIMPMAMPFEKFALTFGDSVSFFNTDKQVAAITRLRKRLEEATEGEVKATVEIVGDSLHADVVEAAMPSHGSVVPRVLGRIPLGPLGRRAAAAAPIITAAAQKSAIDAFREGRIDSATFRQRIAFSKRTDSKKIDIMAGILDQVSGQDQHSLIGSRRTLGMYQPDLGALFFINEMSFFNSLSLDDVKANIVEAVADYGATLGQVQSDEYVIVEYVEYRSPFSARSALLKVPKSAIDAYARGDLDLDGFRKKAVWETQ